MSAVLNDAGVNGVSSAITGTEAAAVEVEESLAGAYRSGVMISKMDN